jgi:biotin carboxylase
VFAFLRSYGERDSGADCRGFGKKMNLSKILFLGAASSQLPVIDYAKRQGYYVITTDYLPGNPGHKISDEYYNISTIEKEKVLELSKRLKINAISAYASDPSALTAAYVSDNMNLTGGSYPAVEILSKKDLFRKCLKENNYKIPWFITGSVLEEISERYNGQKAVLKPVDSSGSKGVHIIENKLDLQNYFQDARNYSISGNVILEEFINRKGPQIHGEGFAVDGKMVFLFLGDQYFSPVNNLIPYSTIVPSHFHKKEVIDKASMLVESFINLIGFKTGGINVEVICDTSNELYILEIGARNGGNYMPQLMKHATGFDLAQANVDALLNKKIDIWGKNIIGHFAQIILHSNRDGIFKKIDVPDDLKRNIIEQHLYYQSDEKVYKYMNSKNVIGVFILSINNDNELNIYLQSLKNHNWVKLE